MLSQVIIIDTLTKYVKMGKNSTEGPGGFDTSRARNASDRQQLLARNLDDPPGNTTSGRDSGLVFVRAGITMFHGEAYLNLMAAKSGLRR